MEDSVMKREGDRKGAHTQNGCSDLEKEVWRLEEALETTKGQVKRYSYSGSITIWQQSLAPNSLN